VKFSVGFDAGPWFAQATESELKSLAADGWRWNGKDSVAAVHAAAMHDDRMARVLIALAKSGRRIHFTCKVDEADASAWLNRRRPNQVQKEEDTDEIRLPLRRSYW
jgi:hypothetical protein